MYFCLQKGMSTQGLLLGQVKLFQASWESFAFVSSGSSVRWALRWIKLHWFYSGKTYDRKWGRKPGKAGRVHRLQFKCDPGKKGGEKTGQEQCGTPTLAESFSKAFRSPWAKSWFSHLLAAHNHGPWATMAGVASMQTLVELRAQPLPEELILLSWSSAKAHLYDHQTGSAGSKYTSDFLFPSPSWWPGTSIPIIVRLSPHPENENISSLTNRDVPIRVSENIMQAGGDQ